MTIGEMINVAIKGGRLVKYSIDHKDELLPKKGTWKQIREERAESYRRKEQAIIDRNIANGGAQRQWPPVKAQPEITGVQAAANFGKGLAISLGIGVVVVLIGLALLQ